MDDSADVAVVVINSRVHHDLAEAEYNRRRSECEQATRFFREHLDGVRTLRDVSAEGWDELSGGLDPVLARRSRHVVTENERTLTATRALEQDDLETTGRCMNASHDSLRDDYEVSCRELDLLVEIARGTAGVYGSRMTGGGFGGCTVTLCRRSAVERLTEAVRTRYQAETGLEPDVLVTRASGPAHLLWVGEM